MTTGMNVMPPEVIRYCTY